MNSQRTSQRPRPQRLRAFGAVFTTVLAATAALSASGMAHEAGPLKQASAEPTAPRAYAGQVREFLSYSRPDKHGVHVERDVLVPMRDGFTLTCDLYRPARADGNPTSGRFPGVVINYTAYGRTVPGGNDLRSFAAKGYNLIWCNTRGAQGVGGASPAPQSIAKVQPWHAQEQRDNYDLIEWFADQPWSTGKIGQIGFSYGGITTLLVAGRQAPPSLKAIIPIMGVTDMYSQFVYPGGIRRATLWSTTCSVTTGEPTCSERLTAEWEGHRIYDPYWRKQMADPRRLRPATLYIGGLQDQFLGSTDATYSALRHRDDFALLLGPWQHGVPEAQQNNPLPQGAYLAWFDYFLRHDDAAPRPPKVTAYQMPPISDDSYQWRGFGSWPSAGAEDRRLHLSSDGFLRRSAGRPGSDSYRVADDGTSGAVHYVTPSFKRSRVVTGPTKVTLTVSMSATDGNLVLSLYDVAPDGTSTRIGRPGFLKMSHRHSHADPEPVKRGKRYQVTVTIPSNFWSIEERHRLRLTVTSADDYVVRDAPAGKVTIFTGRRASYSDVHLATSVRFAAAGSNPPLLPR